MSKNEEPQVSMKNCFNLFLIFCISLYGFLVSATNDQLHLLSKKERNNLVQSLKKNATTLLSIENRRLERASSLLGKENKDSVKKAIGILHKVVKSRSIPSSQKIKAFSLLGKAYASIEDIKNAIKYLEKFIESRSTDVDHFQNTLIFLSRLYIEKKNIKKAKNYLLSWFAISEKEKPRPHVFLAAIYSMEKQKQKALEHLNKAISLADKPDKVWLASAARLNFELQNYSAAEKNLSRLVSLYPSAQMYWGILAQAKHDLNKSQEALASMQVASKIKPLTKQINFINHASLLEEQGIPYLAAKNLKKGLDLKKVKDSQKHYEKLGDLWMQAREHEKAFYTYGESSKREKEDGMIFIKIANFHLYNGDQSKAIKNMLKGIEIGNLDREDEVYFQIGFSYYELKNYNKAVKYLSKAVELSGDREILSRKLIRRIQASLEI